MSDCADWQRYMRVRELEAENEQLRLRMLLDHSVPPVVTPNTTITNGLDQSNYSIQCTDTAGTADKMKQRNDDEDSGIFCSLGDQSRGPIRQCTEL